MSEADDILLAALRKRPTQTYEPDDCCGRRISRVLDTLSAADSWECPKCGVEWRPAIVGTLRHWAPHVPILLFRV